MNEPTTERWPLRSHSVGLSDGREANGREVRTVHGDSGGLGPLLRGAARRKKDGRTLPAVEYRAADRRIDPGSLAQYQKLSGFRVSSVVPSTYIHVQTFPLSMAVMGAAEFPFPLLGLVHVNNRITQVRPIDAAETFDLQVWADRLRDHPAGKQVDLEAQASVAGEIVWRGTSTYLHRSGSLPPARLAGPRPKPRPPLPIGICQPISVGDTRQCPVTGTRSTSAGSAPRPSDFRARSPTACG